MASYSSTGAIQRVTVANSGTYDITGYGGQGGAGGDGLAGGNGAEEGGNFVLSAGEKLEIIVGGGGGGYTGGSGGYYAGGGGGTSFLSSSGSLVSAQSVAGENAGSGKVVITPSIACYRAGTLIRTDGGDVAVERLAIGDLVVTLSGAARRIKWLGRRSYSGRFANANPGVLPICLKAGSLADGVPARDLWVSPKHAMFVGGVLVAAECLVNGVSILQPGHVEIADTVQYFHVELDSHDVILAEGAASETFIDDDSRGMFHNLADFAARYPDAASPKALYCAPRLEHGAELEAIRRAIAARAEPAPPKRRASSRSTASRAA